MPLIPTNTPPFYRKDYIHPRYEWKFNAAQTGTNAPIITTLINTLPAKFTVAYISTGVYEVTASEAILDIALTSFICQAINSYGKKINIIWWSNSKFRIITRNADDTVGNDILENTSFQIDLIDNT